MRRELVETWNGLRKTLVLFPTVDPIDAVCNHMKTWTFLGFTRTFFYVFQFIFRCILLISSFGKLLSSFVYVSIDFIGAGITILMSIPTDRTLTFSVERWKRCGPWRMKWTEACLLPAKVGIFSFINNMIKVLFPICTLNWRVNNYVSRQGKVQIGETKVLLLL